MSHPSIAFHTLGCKLNFAETSSISRLMEKEGYAKKNFNDAADIYVINTCSVTENADKECRFIIRRALRKNPDARIVVIGCYAQLKPKEISEIEGVDLVLGVKEKFQLADYIKQLSEKKSKGVFYSCGIEETQTFNSSYSQGERTRAFLKVQDGCDYSCTYCTIPLARGKSRSDTIQHGVEQAHQLADSGIKEIVLTGVNLGEFGIHDVQSGEHAETFLELIQQLDEVNSIQRFRISSIEPNLLKDEIIEFVAQSKRFMPHFHIPMQSGSDFVLRRMKRRYLSSLYKNRMKRIKSLMPHCCIGADVIVGFPGETEKEFLETYRFLNELNVNYLHVFTYSERENTEAALMDGVVPKQIRHERNEMLRILSEKKQRAFYQEQQNEIRPVLFERDEVGFANGHTDNYVHVRFESKESLHGQIHEVRLMEETDGVMNAQLLNNEMSLVSSHVS